MTTPTDVETPDKDIFLEHNLKQKITEAKNRKFEQAIQDKVMIEENKFNFESNRGSIVSDMYYKQI